MLFMLSTSNRRSILRVYIFLVVMLLGRRFISASQPFRKAPTCAPKASASTSRKVMASAYTYPQPIVINPADGSAPTAAMIFMHGLGDTGDGWSDVVYQFQQTLPHFRFIFPTAPRRPITLNMGMSMPGWFDIASLDGINTQEDAEGLGESQRYAEELVSKEVAGGIPSERIAVGGFSQGGAIALLMLRSNTKLGAVLGLSTWLPLSKAPVILSDANKATPVLMCHGDADNVVAYEYGRQSHSKLTSVGADVDFATYSGMPHSACQAELKDVQEFLAKCLPKKQ